MLEAKRLRMVVVVAAAVVVVAAADDAIVLCCVAVFCFWGEHGLRYGHRVNYMADLTGSGLIWASESPGRISLPSNRAAGAASRRA